MNLHSIWSYARSVASGEISLVQNLDFRGLYMARRLSRVYAVIMGRKPPEITVPIRICSPDVTTAVDTYWSEHTVNSMSFRTKWESGKYYEWLVRDYPLLADYMDFTRERSGQVVLDYGCGPGNDIYRLLTKNMAKRVVGIDVSYKALELAGQRMALYSIDPSRLELIRILDAHAAIPLADGSIDYINCAGVLHHTSDPGKILSEFYRVLRPGGSGHIMVYNENSIFFHLYLAYKVMIVDGKYAGMDIKDAFSRSTDGEECPLSMCYKHEEFTALCRGAGFEADYIGGYFNRYELQLFKTLAGKAKIDERMAQEHREFLRSLKCDAHGYPLYEGKHAGIGGVYKIHKR
jgi:SAM-dependent methyltransferase